jgi:hypothetical protein
MEDLHLVGGVPAVLRYLLKNTDLIDGSQLTVTGKTLAENVEDAVELDFSKQNVVRPLTSPIKPTGHINILRGTLAPTSAVAKMTGHEGAVFEGTAKCFDRFAHSRAQSHWLIHALSALKTFTPFSKQEASSPGWSSSSDTRGQRERLECPRYVSCVSALSSLLKKTGLVAWWVWAVDHRVRSDSLCYLGPTGAIMGAGLGNSTALVTDGALACTVGPPHAQAKDTQDASPVRRAALSSGTSRQRRVLEGRSRLWRTATGLSSTPRRRELSGLA